jgi:hypothetical protein
MTIFSSQCAPWDPEIQETVCFIIVITVLSTLPGNNVYSLFIYPLNKLENGKFNELKKVILKVKVVKSEDTAERSPSVAKFRLESGCRCD